MCTYDDDDDDDGDDDDEDDDIGVLKKNIYILQISQIILDVLVMFFIFMMIMMMMISCLLFRYFKYVANATLFASRVATSPSTSNITINMFITSCWVVREKHLL
jgi:hypothetical protein